MPSYECYYCLFESRYKNDYKRHLNTLKHQWNEDEYGDDTWWNMKSPKNHPKITQNDISDDPKITQNPKKNILSEQPKCDHCCKTFTTQAHVSRHMIHNCKVKKQNAAYENTIEHQKQLITTLSNKVGDTNITNNITGNTLNNNTITSNTLNNTITSNTLNNNNNNNIILNPYGQEDFSHITDDMALALLKQPYEMIPKLFELLHFNKDQPKNNNIRYQNKKENMVEIWVDNAWKYRDKNTILDRIINEHYNWFDNMYESLQEHLRVRNKRIYDEFTALYNADDPTLYDNMRHKCCIHILNARV